MWALEALKVLLPKHEPSFTWLIDEDASAPIFRQTILAELGRIPDPDDMLAVARLICERKPKTRDAVATIRAYRMGRRPKSSPAGLVRAVASAIREYVAGHSEITCVEIARTLRLIADAFEESPC
jgi:hypothetical protein